MLSDVVILALNLVSDYEFGTSLDGDALIGVLVCVCADTSTNIAKGGSVCDRMVSANLSVQIKVRKSFSFYLTCFAVRFSALFVLNLTYFIEFGDQTFSEIQNQSSHLFSIHVNNNNKKRKLVYSCHD